MDQDTRLFHNPRCSKSRAALALLRDRGVEPRLVPYLEQPPTIEELRELLRMLGCPAHELVRTGEAAYAEQSLDRAGSDEATLITAMHRDPRLIERPIFVHAGRAVIGRPPERVLELLD